LLLRRLDRERRWESLDDRRVCLHCRTEFSGRQIDVVGGTRELGRLRLLCPTENCPSTSNDWILPQKKIAANGRKIAARESIDLDEVERWRSEHLKKIGRFFRVSRANA
jgi:hypothetical protein